MSDFLEEILKIKEEGKNAALATIIGTKGSTPREVGAKMLVQEDGKIFGTIGGGCIEAEVWQEAMKIIKEEKPRTVHFDLTGKKAEDSGMICGGIMDIYIEPIVPTPRVYVFGGGHISLFVAKISKMVGFEVVVIDDRPQFANRERFPEADEVIAEEFEFALPKLKVNRSNYLVIVTRGHAYDQEVLEWALKTEARYVGMIGSRRKIQIVFTSLKEKGIAAETLKQVHAPIGLDIGALTPEEIAVAIVAEMIQKRRRGEEEKRKRDV
jgi:xanthine dehydrogenase accessory factor